MNKQFYFTTGLPRSGTTLLSAVLNQNPDIYSSISGPLARFTRAIIQESSSQGGYQYQCTIETRKKILHGIFDNYYNHIDKPVIFDHNRGWTLLLHVLKDLFPYTKVVLCVRDIKWILDSFETLIRKNPYSITNMFSQEEGLNVYTRCDTLMHPHRTVGFAYTSLKQAITSNEKTMLFILDYEKLCKFPKQTMKELYAFIEQPYFEHDFDNVDTSYKEFDDDINLPGLHTTRQKLSWIERDTTIPPDIQHKYSNMEIWK
jgi:sulfotransferase